MPTLRALDEYVIDNIFQPVVDFLYSIFEIDQFKIARICLLISCALLLASNLATTEDPSLCFFLIVCTLVGASLTLLAIYLAEHNMSNNGRNKERLNIFYRVNIWAMCILMNLCLCMPLAWSWLIISIFRASILFLTCTAYFMACDWPPPPVQKRKRVFVPDPV